MEERVEVALVLQIQEQSVEVTKVILQERVSERIVALIVAVPQIQEHVDEVFTVIPQEWVSERIVAEIVVVPQEIVGDAQSGRERDL